MVGKTHSNTALKAFNCPSCGATLRLTAVGLTISVACGSCGSIIDTANENYKILSKFKNLKVTPLIPLGSRGTLKDNLWEVIGFMQRCDETEMYFWQEYLLFNPRQGFRWLTEMDGHWNFVSTITGKPRVNEGTQEALYTERFYKLFVKGKAKVTFVLGEFYWRVKVGETVNIADYVNPPYALSNEMSANETIWSQGEYITSGEIQKSFNLESSLPSSYGVAPNQPNPHTIILPFIGKCWGGFMGILFILFILASIVSNNTTVLDESFLYEEGDKSTKLHSIPVSLDGDLDNLEITLYAPVSNNWLHLEGSLADDKGNVYDFELGVEYYFGRDSDGSWSEGGQKSKRILPMIPGGHYDLVFKPSTPLASLNYTITIKRDVTLFSNFFLLASFLSIYPGWVIWRKSSFESKRWSNSDYGPEEDA